MPFVSARHNQLEAVMTRDELAALPAGCAVYTLPVRIPGFAVDLDCCLDAPRSPLTAVYPRLHLRDLDPLPGAPPSIPVAATSEGDCAVYYEGAACSIRSAPSARSHLGPAFQFYQEECAALHASLEPIPLALRYLTPRNINDLFAGERPRVSLYRVKR
jgi:hypothetical protein